MSCHRKAVEKFGFGTSVEENYTLHILTAILNGFNKQHLTEEKPSKGLFLKSNLLCRITLISENCPHTAQVSPTLIPMYLTPKAACDRLYDKPVSFLYRTEGSFLFCCSSRLIKQEYKIPLPHKLVCNALEVFIPGYYQNAV